MSHATAEPLGALAKRCADTRRTLVGAFKGEIGLPICLDLMGIEPQHANPGNYAFARIIADTHADTLADATLYLADDDMVDLLDASANTMPDQELVDTDLPGPRGFIYFATPLPDRSGQPPELPIHAMSWAFIPDGHAILEERGVGHSLLITSYVAVADQIRAMGDDPALIRPGTPRLLPNATVMWTFGTLIGEVYGDIPDTARFTPGFYQRVMAAFWTLIAQPRITRTEDTPPGRPSDQRRYRRAGIVNPSAPVHLVRLYRRPVRAETTTTSTGATGRHVSVRFPVRGFWRRQWYPSIESHRHIWIDPHFRGPEDAPLVSGERVFLSHGAKAERPEPPKT